MYYAKIVSGLAVICFIALTVNSILQKAPVWHEPSQLLAGLNMWYFGRFDTQEVNPPLARGVSVLPLLALSPSIDNGVFNRPPLNRNEFAMGDVLVRKNGDRSRLLFVAANCTCLVFAVTGLVFCYIFANNLYGTTSACLSLLLLCFSPFILGHSSTIMNDVPAAFMAVIAIFFFWKWLQYPELLEAIIAGIVLGLAMLTKFTLLIFYPLLFVIWLLYQSSNCHSTNLKTAVKQFGNLCVIYLISIFVINAAYLGEGTFSQLETFRFRSMALSGKSADEMSYEGDNRFTGTLLGKLPIPIPASMVRGLDLQKFDFERGLPSYLRGEWSEHGWWYYYLYALLIKTPLGTILLFVLAIACSFVRGFNASRCDEMLILLPGLVLLAFVSSQTGFSVHSRYVIPALPFFFIWISKVGKAFTLKRPVIATLVTIMLTWSIASSLSVYPHSISYFNELAAIIPTPNEQRSPQEPVNTPPFVKTLNAGSRNGGRHLLDSNIDWGQDIFYLERWCLQHPEVKEIYTALSGSYPLEQTKIPTKSPSPEKLQRGWYAISVNHLYSKDGNYKQFLDKQPAARIGYSIYVYHVQE